MKKQLILLIAIFSLSFAFGQWTTVVTNNFDNFPTGFSQSEFSQQGYGVEVGGSADKCAYDKIPATNGYVAVQATLDSGYNYRFSFRAKRGKNPTCGLTLKYDASTGSGGTAVSTEFTPPKQNGSGTGTQYVSNVITGDGNTYYLKVVTTTGSSSTVKVRVDGYLLEREPVASNTPTITLTPTSLTGFTYEEGNGPSAEQTYTISGSNLTHDIVITPPTNWEISLNSGSFFQTSSITLPQSGGTVSSTTIYVRMVSGLLVANSPFSGNVTHTSTGAIQVDLAVDGTVTAPVLPCSQLLISEYGEPSSGNGKYIEIYNPTSQTINLANYELWKITNGGNWPEVTYSLTSNLAPYTTYTVANNNGDVPNASEYTSTSIMSFSGDDALGLAYNGGSGNSFSLIDVIGTDGGDPGSGWDVAGVTNGTKDHTLIRKASVQAPNTDWVSSAGTTTADSEWEVVTYGLGNFGSHTSDCFCSGTTTTWSTSGWSNGVPTIHDRAIINSDYNSSQSGNIEACTLEITSGILNIELGNYVKVQKDIINNSSIVIDNQGALVQVENSATVTGTGTYSTTVKTTSMADARYTYFSSPTQADTMNVFNSWVATDRMFGWDGINQDWSAVTTATAMTTGLGYIVRPTTGASFPAQFTTNFTGAFNNGIVTTTLYNTNVYSGNDDDSSLVGNPYPSAIDTQALLNANPNANAFYFWAHTTAGDWSNENYKIWNDTGTTNGPATISTGQGFFVTSTAASVFTFSNDQRVTGSNNTFLRPANNLDKIWLNVISNTSAGNQILVGFIPNKTAAFDAKYDAKQFNTNIDDIALVSNGTGSNTANLGIQARGLLNSDDTIVPLTVFVNNETINSATISIDHLENLTDTNIYLRDNILNILTDLKQGDYQFTVSQTGAIDNRFELVFSRNALGVDDHSVATDLIITQKGDFFNLNTTDGSKIKAASLYNMLGQELGNYQSANGSLQIPSYKYSVGSVLIIKTTLDNGNVISKKVVKL